MHKFKLVKGDQYRPYYEASPATDIYQCEQCDTQVNATWLQERPEDTCPKAIIRDSETNGHKPKRGSRKGKGNISIDRKAEMVAALPAFDNCHSQVARVYGVSADIVDRAVKSEVITELAEVKKEEIGRKLGLLVDKLTQRFLDIADSASLDNKAAILLGIAADKHRLYLGEPTAITETRNDAALRDDALKLLSDYKAALDGDEVRAKALLAEDAPIFAQYIN